MVNKLSFTKGLFLNNQWDLSEWKIGTNFWNTLYNGAFENWLAFWNKFEAEIDKTGLPAVTKFAYL